MSYVCDNCHKAVVSGRTQTHGRGVAGKRWKKRAPMTTRLFRPNLQKATVHLAGKIVKMKLCTSCIKRFKKDGKIKTYKTRSSFAGSLA
ncbi:MAG TPA: L28 family ribosomal protein [Candidatus Saccharimonadales bacterium]|nr:L28 family ribosomal protein [Candidatus Saccharimonadales bacterium]